VSLTASTLKFQQRTLLTVIALALALASCRDSNSGPPIAVQSRPLAVFDDDGASFVENVRAARDLRIATCLRDRGFDAPISTPPPPSPAGERHGLLGVDNAEQAREFGYQIETSTPVSDAFEAYLDRLDAAELTAITEALYGSDPGTATEPYELPDGTVVEVEVISGCVGEARAEVEGDTGRFIALRRAVEDIANAAVTRARSDDRYLEAEQAWSRCMADQGYEVDKPEEAPMVSAQLFPGAAPTAAEREMAVTDVDCKDTTGLVEVYRTVRNGYEQQQLDQQPGLLPEWSRVAGETQQRAEAILAG